MNSESKKLLAELNQLKATCKNLEKILLEMVGRDAFNEHMSSFPNITTR